VSQTNSWMTHNQNGAKNDRRKHNQTVKNIDYIWLRFVKSGHIFTLIQQQNAHTGCDRHHY